MKRTVLLIGILIVTATLLLIYAVASHPSKKREPEIKLPLTVSPGPINDTILSFSPDYVMLSTSEAASIDIKIDTGRNQITGVQVELAYDPEVFTDIKIEPGTFFPQANVLLNNNDKKSGRYSYALVLPPTTPPLTGSGTVAKVSLKKFANVSNTQSPTALTILPKSLVSAIGVEGSVLRETKSATIVFMPSSLPDPDTVSNEKPNVGTYEGVPIAP